MQREIGRALLTRHSLARSFSSPAMAFAARQVLGIQLDYNQKVTVPVRTAPGAAARLAANPNPRPATAQRVALKNRSSLAHIAIQAQAPRPHPNSSQTSLKRQKSWTAAHPTQRHPIIQHSQHLETDRDRRKPRHDPVPSSMVQIFRPTQRRLRSKLAPSLMVIIPPCSSGTAAKTCTQTFLLLLILPLPSAAEIGLRMRLVLLQHQEPNRATPQFRNGPFPALFVRVRSQTSRPLSIDNTRVSL